MGSGISLCEKQTAEIIERELVKEYCIKQSCLPLYTDDGYEIFRDFSEEVILNNNIKKVYLYAKFNPKLYKK
jgi:hypothetical protein